MTAERRAYVTLDGMRGVAALSVVAVHSPALFGSLPLPSAYLAVDLFFVLSGFVLSHAYDGRGIGLWAFMRLRAIRLYPLYLIGLLLGLLLAIALIYEGRQPLSYLLSVPFGLLGLPTPFGDQLFPYNPPAWSLFFEMMINVTFCTAIFHSRRAMIGLAMAAGAGLIFAAVRYGSLHNGWERDML